jgi:VanZ family protein
MAAVRLPRRVSLWAPVVLWAAVIFVFSSVPNLGTDLGVWDTILRKCAHATEYAILALLLFRALTEGLDETSSVPPGRAARPDAASSAASVPSRYERSLRPRLGTSIAPRRRAKFRQALPGRDVPAFLLGLAYAVTDELHQELVRGRHASPFDVAVDAAGLALGLLVLHATRLWTPSRST